MADIHEFNDRFVNEKDLFGSRPSWFGKIKADTKYSGSSFRHRASDLLRFSQRSKNLWYHTNLNSKCLIQNLYSSPAQIIQYVVTSTGCINRSTRLVKRFLGGLPGKTSPQTWTDRQPNDSKPTPVDYPPGLRPGLHTGDTWVSDPCTCC